MKRLILILLAFLLLAAGCADERAPDPDYDPGPQLVTERYLRRELDLHTLQTLDVVIAQMLLDQHAVVVGSHLSAHWDRDATGYVVYKPRNWAGTPFVATVIFGAPGYAADGGSVTETNCKNLPGGGVSTTGEYSTVENDTDEPIEHEISDSVTETESHSTSLTETVEFDFGLTVEAGASFGGAETKATAEVSRHLGLTTESIAAFSHESTHTVADKQLIPEHRTFTNVDTTDNSAMVCDLQIDATGDWGALQVIPPVGRPYAHDTWCSTERHPDGQVYEGRGSNGDILLHSDAVRKSDCTIQLDEADSFVRLVEGYDVRCPHCAELSFGPYARRALDWFGMQASRHVSFDGKRRSGAHRDASYRAFDTTGYDQSCIDRILEEAGTIVGDGLLDGCQP